MNSLKELIARWDTDEGRPYKGSLIDKKAHKNTPDNIGCMCAQGQVLHLVGGWSPTRLSTEGQGSADQETAKLLNISKAHAVLLRGVNDQTHGAPSAVLTDLKKVIGEEWSTILDFWHYLDGLTSAQFSATRVFSGDINSSYSIVRYAAYNAVGRFAWNAAHAATRDASWGSTWHTTRDAARAAMAVSEIQGSNTLNRQGTPLFFLPMFGFASVSEIPPRPADYGPKDIQHV